MTCGGFPLTRSLPFSYGQKRGGEVAALTVEPGRYPVRGFLITSLKRKLLLLKPPDDALLGGSGDGPLHALLSVIPRDSWFVQGDHTPEFKFCSL